MRIYFRAAFAAMLITVPLLAKDPLSKRVMRADEDKLRVAKSVHAGAGELHFTGLFDAQTFNTNLIFLHRGVVMPKSGIGHHFHNHMEEMFVIFDGEAQFTVNGRTSLLKAPAGAPNRMGNSHAIYNPGDKPIQWMNIAVGSIKGKYDATDLGDSREGVALDPKPVFITMRLDKALLKPSPAYHGGTGTARYRRALMPEVFYTNWSYVDHLVLPQGAGDGRHRHEGVEEFYYVMNGQGTFKLGGESVTVRAGDAIPVFLNEVHSVENPNAGELELMIVGIARVKWALDTVEVK